LKAGSVIVALALSAHAGIGAAATPTTQELQNQIDELKGTISALK